MWNVKEFQLIGIAKEFYNFALQFYIGYLD